MQSSCYAPLRLHCTHNKINWVLFIYCFIALGGFDTAFQIETSSTVLVATIINYILIDSFEDTSQLDKLSCYKRVEG